MNGTYRTYRTYKTYRTCLLMIQGLSEETSMKRLHAFALLFTCSLSIAAVGAAFGRDAKLVRYSHYHQSRIVFTYLAYILTADENGQNMKIVTVHRASDLYPRFST